MDISRKARITILLVAFLIVGAGAATAAMHAITGDPAFCGTCHVMDNYMGTWEHSSHKDVAGCNDCHTDQSSYAAKTWSKATAGARHAYVNYLSTPPMHLKMVESSKNVVQENCVRCHTELVANTPQLMNPSESKYCFNCHRTMPHGRERIST